LTAALLESLVAHPLAQAVGWGLAHSVWQGALVAAAFAAANRALRESSAQARYVAGCAALALLVALPITTALADDAPVKTAARLQTAPAPDAARGAETSGAHASVGERLMASVFFDGVGAEESVAAAVPALLSRARFERLLPWLALAWAACVLLLAARLAVGWAGAARLGRAARARDRLLEWEPSLARLARRMKVNRAVRLCRSALVEVPTVVGWLRPVVLVPAGALAGLSPAQVEAVLAHELAHVRRYDYLVNLLQTLVETVLFFHPAAWWISGRVRAEREHACDDLAVGAVGDVLLYARALAALEESRQGLRATRLALAANGGSLVGRIQRLIRPQPVARSPRAPAALAALALTCAAVFAHAAAATHGKDAPRALKNESAPRAAATGRRVAVTLVAVPMIHTWHHPRAERDTRKLLTALASRNIRAVGFVNAGRLYRDGQVSEEKVGLLRLWLDAGHELGSEGYAHLSLFKTPLEEYKRDVLRGEELTSRLAAERGARLRYFSYPFLNVGPDRAAKEAFGRWNAARGMQTHKVTIDNLDWLYGKVYADARREEDEAKMRRVADEYVEYMERAFEFYEQLSRETLGYEPPQVLMLTANALNCEKAGELLAMLERRGYSFVTLEEAMADAAYQLPDTYTGEWGISWLQRWAMARGREFRKEPYLSDWMAQFDAYTKKWPPVEKQKN
jgi:beta-lactamase regulating signal transducer with metallopeptidase domain/peptidoglycan/xylan/chitin deacetylase (PgdA/CDA1 family)